MPGADELINPSGKPLTRDPKLIVIKAKKDVQQRLNPNLVSQICNITGCDTIILPMDSEIMMGKLAKEELESMHSACHAILQLPDINFTKEELKAIYNTLHWAQEKLGFSSDSPEVSVLKQTKKLIE